LVGGSYRVGEARILLQTAPTLGAASSFAVLGGQTVTNTGPTIVNGDLGVSPGSAVTGFPPGIVVGGTIHAGDAVAGQAQSDTTIAYNNLAGQPCDTDLTGQDLGGMTLTPGVYCFSTSAQLTGTLTLDAEGDPNAVFIFQIGSTLTTASNSTIALINGASACNVFFQVGSSATVGTSTTFEGNILALTSITLNTGASVSARTLARNGAVTLDNNLIGEAGCATGTDVGTDTGTDVGTDDGTDVGDDVGTDTGTDTGADDGTDVGTDDGTDTGTDDGTDVGADVGTDVGTDTGTDVGVDVGDDKGTDTGETPDSQQGEMPVEDDKQGELPVTGGAPVSALLSLSGVVAAALVSLGFFAARRKA
jgi:hypothetical protein